MPSCPALLIAAPASGQGKTTLTAAFARLHAREGRRVRVFKCGPDFLDPQILVAASGAPVYNLDLAMCGEQDARARLGRAAAQADLILVEGVMGLYDGEPSAADLAIRFSIPVLAVIDASAMAQTFGALARGLATHRVGLPFAGVLANRVAGARHARMLRDSLPPGMGWYGALEVDPGSNLPERHLGLVQAREISNLASCIDRLADRLAGAARDLPAPVDFDDAGLPAPERLLAGLTIAIARDAAFAFIYPANVDLLREMGAELCFFSPLAGEPLPGCDALWLPGGYPELHGEALAARRDLWIQVRNHARAGRALVAECGGMMALLDEIVTRDGVRIPLAGMLPGRAVLQPRPTAIGVQCADLPEGGVRGHTFHYSRAEIGLQPLCRATSPDGRVGEAIYRCGRTTASYLHFYFPSNPGATAALFLP